MPLVTVPGLKTRELFAMTVLVDRFISFGGESGPSERLATLAGGSFVGDRLAGDVLAGGTDWQKIHADGAIEIDAGLALETRDGALIGMTYSGLRHANAATLARIEHGDEVDPGDYYFRIVARFTTDHPDYRWLNRIIAVGTGERVKEGPRYKLHQIL